VNYKLVGIY